MTTAALFLTVIAMSSAGAAQDTPSAKTSLAQTIRWLIDFSVAHRVPQGNNVYRAGAISSPAKCILEIDMSVARFEKKWSVNRVTATVKLAQLRHISWLADVGGLPRQAVRLQSGAEPAIEEVIKTGDDLTTTTQPKALDLLFDSSKASAEFGQAISHAIFLCGGKASLN